MDQTEYAEIKRVKEIVAGKKAEIFASIDHQAEITEIFCSKKINKHPLSYGRLVTVHFMKNNHADELTIYLKFRKNYRQVPDKYMAIYDKIPGAEQFLPNFYFHTRLPGTEESVIAMEYIKGASLRKLLYRKMLFNKTSELAGLFFQNGRKMRLFHNVQSEKGARTIQVGFEAVVERFNTSQYFTADEKKAINQHLQKIKTTLPMSFELPLINIHHDWSLRNIIVERDNRIKLIDLDAFDRSINWGWEDFVYFLINIESQIKYWPFLTTNHLKFLWEHFYQGYFDAGQPKSITEDLMPALIYLLKLHFWTDTYSLDDFYNRGLGKRYVLRLKIALTNGYWTIFSDQKL